MDHTGAQRSLRRHLIRCGSHSQPGSGVAENSMGHNKTPTPPAATVYPPTSPEAAFSPWKAKVGHDGLLIIWGNSLTTNRAQGGKSHQHLSAPRTQDNRRQPRRMPFPLILALCTNRH